MTFPSKEILYLLKKQYPAGTRVRLLEMDDPQAPPVGTMGTIRGVDDIGSVLVAWDTGSSLSLVYEKDKFEVVKEEEN